MIASYYQRGEYWSMQVGESYPGIYSPEDGIVVNKTYDSKPVGDSFPTSAESVAAIDDALSALFREAQPAVDTSLGPSRLWLPDQQ